MNEAPTVTVRFNLSFFPVKYEKCDIGVTISGVSTTAPERDVESAAVKAHELLAKAMHQVYDQAKLSVAEHGQLSEMRPEVD